MFRLLLCAASAQEPAPEPAPEPVPQAPPPSVLAAPQPSREALARFEAERLIREAPNVVGGYAPLWVVHYPDSAPMDTPTFLQTVGSLDHQREMHRLQQKDIGLGLGLVIGGAALQTLGFATMTAGFTLATSDPSYGDPSVRDGIDENIIIGVGGGMFLAGFPVYYASALPFFRHSRREKHPSLLLEAEEADRLIEGYHDKLKSELGLQ